MKHLALESVKATYLTLDPQRKEHNFELLGMDFMIDDCLKPWLIEINTNPCLELSSPLLSKIIPTLIEQTFRYKLIYVEYALIQSSLRLMTGQLQKRCTSVITYWSKTNFSLFLMNQLMGRKYCKSMVLTWVWIVTWER